MGILDDIGSGISSVYNGVANALPGIGIGTSASDAAKMAALNQQGQQADQFATQQQAGFNALGQQGQTALNYLSGQMQGQNSVSALQLQAAQQANAAKMASLAASAAPQNAAMMARTAANNINAGNVGLAGQQAIAGQAERDAAAGQYANTLGTLRGQDLTGVDAARQAAISSFSNGLNGSRDPTLIQQLGPAASGAAAALSDERLKKDVREGDALKLDALKSYTYAYKDEKHGEAGEGRYGGIMAQDLERAGSRAVIDTPVGKAVHGARLATELAGSVAQMNARLKALEAA